MNAHAYNAPIISVGTIARTACLLLALTNQVLSALGKPVLPIESQTVEQLVTAGITTVAALVAWWKNNSFTAAAIQADQTYDKLKAQSKPPCPKRLYIAPAPGSLTVPRGCFCLYDVLRHETTYFGVFDVF